jgi:hypothetical protein
VPRQQSLRRDDRCNLRQNASAESLCSESESTALVVCKPESPTAELLTQDFVLLAQILDCLLLLFIHPAGNGDQHEPEWIEDSHIPNYHGLSALSPQLECSQDIPFCGQYEISLSKRWLVEKPFGWLKQTGGLKKAKLRGLAKIDWLFVFSCAAFNLLRIPRLREQPA